MTARGCIIVVRYICSAKRNVLIFTFPWHRFPYLLYCWQRRVRKQCKGSALFLFHSNNGYAKGSQGYIITYIAYPFTTWTKSLLL